MAELSEITKIGINVCVNISEETVTRCCRILEMYLADNPNMIVMSERGAYPHVWIGVDKGESEVKE